jgi:hypothetical protein
LGGFFVGEVMPVEKVDKKLEFIDWYDDPQKKGSLEEKAAEMGLHFSTLYRWVEEIEAIRGHKAVTPDKAQKILAELEKEALNPRSTPSKIKALELFSKWTGMFEGENKEAVLTGDACDRIINSAEFKNAELRRKLNSGVPGL